MTTRKRLFEIRSEIDAAALDLMRRKNADYAQEGAALENYDLAARLAGTSPALYILGRVGEKAVRLRTIIKAGGPQVAEETVARELVDLVNFPSLIAAALEAERGTPTPQ